MIYLVETVDVAPADTDAYLEAFGRLYLPGARERGLDLVACWTTPRDIGEDVTVMVVLAVAGWAEWERARNAAVADPSLAEWITTRGALMRRGTRRFFEATELDPRVRPDPGGGG